MDPVWIGAIAALIAAPLAGAGVVLQLRARRPVVVASFSPPAVGADGSFVRMGVSVQDAGDTALVTLYATPFLDGKAAGERQGPRAIPVGLSTPFNFDLPLSDDLDPRSFDGSGFAIRVDVSRQTLEIPYVTAGSSAPGRRVG